MKAEQTIDALSYDQRNDRLMVGAAAGTRLLAVDTRMQVISSVAVTPPAGSGRLALSVSSADSTIAMTRAGNRAGSTLRWEGGAGNKTAKSPFDGLAAGPLMKVARSVSMLDAARSKLPAWRLGHTGRQS